MTETLANGYSYESTQRGLSNKYQDDRVWMIFTNICVLVLWTNVASALEGLSLSCTSLLHVSIYNEFENIFEIFKVKLLLELK